MAGIPAMIDIIAAIGFLAVMILVLLISHQGQRLLVNL